MKPGTKTAQAEDKLDQHRRAIRANPRNARAHALLGLAQLELGQLENAVASQRRALALDPALTGLHAVLAPALHMLGQHEDAAASYRRALAVNANDPEMHKGLSDVLRALKQYEPAAASARRAIALAPTHVDAHLCLAASQFLLGDYGAAAAAFGQVLELDPGHVDARLDLAQTLFKLRQFDTAAHCCRHEIDRNPAHFRAHAMLGACLRESGQYAAAAASYERALALTPDDTTALTDLGVTLQLLGKLEPARAVLRRALELKPGDGAILRALAHACFELGHWEDAVAYARRLVEAEPSPMAHSVLLFILSHCCNDAADMKAEHFQFGERWEAPLRALWAPHANERDPARRLRVGFVSADLYHHAVSRFIEPVFRALKDSQSLTLHVYYNHVVEDELTRQLRSYIPHWRQIDDLSDEVVEQQIRDDGIDILIDLSGHSARNRLPLFARKPAPVQASWIGYAATTGLQAMDYYLSDQFHLPEGRYDDQFTEQIVRLPLVAPFLPEDGAPDVNPLPALANGYLTFGSFHRASKLSREVIALWAQLLHALPDSRIVLGGLQVGTDDTLLAWFDDEGIARERLILRQRTNVHDYLAQHHDVDVCLSPFPYTGSTTICHALWMGVPTLTTIGPTSPSHSSVCYLAHVGLSSFLADDADTYVKLGQFLAQNLPTLAALRTGMRERFTSSVVGYPGVCAAGLEHGLRLMWQNWCAGLPAAPLRVRLSDLVDGQQAPAGE